MCRGARAAGVPDGFSQTWSDNRPPARTPRLCPSLAAPQPERPPGPLSNARNEQDVQIALRGHRSDLTQERDSDFSRLNRPNEGAPSRTESCATASGGWSGLSRASCALERLIERPVDVG